MMDLFCFILINIGKNSSKVLKWLTREWLAAQWATLIGNQPTPVQSGTVARNTLEFSIG
jgi:hypothetical protein